MAADDDCVLFAVSDGIARITLNRPAQRNAISLAVHRQLNEALNAIETRADVRAMLLTGNGPAFCAGQDLSERKLDGSATEAAAAVIGESVGQRYNPLVRRLSALPVPWVCAVNGAAAGAGASIALLADLTVAALSAKFVYAFTRIGLMPDSGGNWLLASRIGTARATAMAMTGEAVSAQQAEDWGLIWKAVPDTDLVDAADAAVRMLAAGPTRALIATRVAMRAASGLDFDAMLELELEGQRQLAASADYREGVLAFQQKRAVRFEGK